MRCRPILSALAVVSMAGGNAVADTIHVPGDWLTIQQAMVAAVDGDEIVVAPGDYNELVDFLGKAVLLRRHQQRVLVAIDKAGSIEELTLQPLGHRLSNIDCIAGAALADAGELTLVLDAAELVQRLLEPQPKSRVDSDAPRHEPDRDPEE